MAGRDSKKLEQIRTELSRINPAVQEVPILTADANDVTAVGAVVRQAEVVLSTAGPFARYGDNVVAQAVEQATHYADITAARGVKILHCCGYDSVPSDLGAFMMVEYCKEKLGCGVSQVCTLVGPSRAGVSGGTLESAFNLIMNEKSSELAAVASDQYYLASLQGLRGSDKPAGILPRYVAPARGWAGPFVMEGVNAKIVQESNALFTASSYPYGKDFKYYEGVAASGLVGAGLITAATALIGVVAGLPPLRALARRFLPAPGQGPSEEVRKSGYWSHELVALTEEEQPRVVRGRCEDRRDPGYWSTSRMLLETGLALVLDAPRLAADPRLSRGGVLSPAAACGTVLIERLRAAGFTFEVTGVEGEEGKRRAGQ
ncbi:hypothetical protein VOLCADRAFT_86200 [Volvox carteri f. nagariensis]|uniref:Saccharopine dehydrogenase NADP binding domain-containing protein n=1 Tax=Volvox carteri f. nagariensis TaxID=3068 RepID=D8TI55_VOLCA|nr:uncharacterized protein VOLCADRAFT_86200 [Volvox carteri f. nagariensis]EFJ53178.1 hypothetical protein VOLCADRAFT_86200 [Volvox carteri f. nagariensis]|eukprot:XP_002946183.1 hypothetical protein VOLCADRAFT_86200 [Volvox carteri f. nagariensis]